MRSGTTCSAGRSIEATLHPERSRYACIGTNLALTGNDPNWMAAPAFRQRVSAFPKPSLQELWELVGVSVDLVMLAVQLGWELGYK